MAFCWKKISGIFFVFLGLTHFSITAQEPLPLQVVTSWSILEDVVKNVGRSRVQVHSLAPRGADLHDFKLTPGDQVRLRKADWVVWLGLGLEGWLEPSMKQLAKEKQLQVEKHLTGLLPIHSNPNFSQPSSQESHQKHDPHLWHSVPMMIQVCEVVAEALSKRDPNYASIYRDNANQYIQKLKQLDLWIHQQLSFIPASQRILVTSHKAFEYFGKTYGFQTWAPRGFNHNEQPTPRMMREIIEELKKKKVKVLFPEAEANPSLLKQIARETEIEIKGVLLTGNLTTSDKEGATYESFMRTNIQNITEAFRSDLNQ